MKIVEIPAKTKEQKTVRVAAYARVSVEKDATFHSLEAQTDYYRKLISTHPGWVLVDIYSDNGISGTIIDRPEFQRMLQDCRDKKIDLVITKSVTRFARNTVILLDTIRELKKLGIDCFFEKENMHSISPDGELFLTLLAMYAEEEARSASENQKWRIRRLFDQGKLPYGRLYGYRFINGKFEIVEEEAAVIRLIFELYLSGYGCYKIAAELNRRNHCHKGYLWYPWTIRCALENEKYAGDLLLQKTYVSDFRTKKVCKNNGELRKVYIKNDHEAIIDRDTFLAVQQEIKRRAAEEKERSESFMIDVSSEKDLFRGLIHCGKCGSSFRRKIGAAPYRKVYWVCKKYISIGKHACGSRMVPEPILLKYTKEVLETERLSKQLITEKLSGIIAAGNNHLIYEFRDGSKKEVTWVSEPRNKAWTEEKRQMAKEKTLAKHRKEREHETGN